MAVSGLLQWEVFEARDNPTEWRVEAVELDEGRCYIAIFSGPDAEVRAREYAAWKAAS